MIAASAVVVLLLPRGETPQDGSRTPDATKGPEYAGSVSCRECHERFYELWAPSRHGRAMQVFTADLAREELTAQAQPVAVGDYAYRADLSGEQAAVIETGPKGEKRYPIAHAMGGKILYYFLTPLGRGRLHLLPVAYDVREKAWIDTMASMVRHVADRPVHWTDPLLTFNTSCHGCHVSQLETNYDADTDSYRTTWAEPGINCEACHGSAVEHIRVCREAPEGQPPADLKILSYNDFSVEQTNATCAVCHAKARPITCHTSSGRYRFKGENANSACLPCHQARVENAAAHHRHPKGKPGSRCVDCHMPTTRFAKDEPFTPHLLRMYFVIGTLQDMARKANQLVAFADYEPLDFTEGNTPLVALYPKRYGKGQRVLSRQAPARGATARVCKVYAHPVKGSLPLFVIKDNPSGRYFLTTDPYAECEREPFQNPLKPGEPGHNKYEGRTVYRAYKRKTDWIELLGFVMLRAEADTASFPSVALSSIPGLSATFRPGEKADAAAILVRK